MKAPAIIPDRLERVRALQLGTGNHRSPEAGMCVMEAVAYVAGEDFSDSPECACPILASFLRAWNDGMPDADRQKLKPYVERLVGSRGSKALEQKRGLLIADWYLRTFTPAWLELAGLSEHAEALRSANAVTKWSDVTALQPKLNDARDQAAAAWDAARDAARAAAWDAAWAAALKAPAKSDGPPTYDVARAAAEAALGPWAGNERERAVKRRGWGFYASHIGSPGNIYMRRFILLLPFGLGTIRLHNIVRSDDDRHLHDHPFDFVSFLLTGGYVEHQLCSSCGGEYGTGASRCDDCWDGRRRKAWPRFSIVRKHAEELHSLTLERPVWTLVFAGPKRREWGFETERGWIPNHRYLDEFPARAEWRDTPAREAV